MSDLRNLLIVSDLHLGGVLRPAERAADAEARPAKRPRLGFGRLRQAVRLDRALARFIDHHRRTPHPGPDGAPVPWTLLFNGDTIDFLHMDLRPDGDEAPAPDAEEQRYGLAFDARRSVWKMQVIARYHRRTFAALARFIEAGHQVVLVVGNHDVDLWFRDVRQAFVAQVARHAREPEQIAAGLRFEPWFYYEPGRAYVEHGHRFDPFATFPDPLAPLAAHRERTLAPNFGHFGLRYFCNRIRSFPVHDLDTMTAGDLWRWMKRHSPLALLRAAWQTVTFLWVYARATAADRLSRRRREAMTRARRRDRLRTFAARARLPLTRVLALDGLRRAHVGDSVTRLAQALMLDRIALLAVVAMGLVFAFTRDDPGVGGWLTAAVLGGAGLAWWGLDRVRPQADIHPSLGRLARRIGRLIEVPVVVFGHTHRPTIRRLGRTRWLNPGSWEHLPRQHLHGPDEPCDCQARFGVITGAAIHTRVKLQRWCRRVEQPVPIEIEA